MEAQNEVGAEAEEEHEPADSLLCAQVHVGSGCGHQQLVQALSLLHLVLHHCLMENPDPLEISLGGLGSQRLPQEE